MNEWLHCSKNKWLVIRWSCMKWVEMERWMDEWWEKNRAKEETIERKTEGKEVKKALKNNSFQKRELPERDVWTQNKEQKINICKNFQYSVTSHFSALHLIYQLKEEFSAVSTLNIFVPVRNFILGQCYVKNQVTVCQITTSIVTWYWKIISYSVTLTEVMGYEEDGAMGSGLNSSYLKNNFCWAALTPVCTAISSWNFANLCWKTVLSIMLLEMSLGTKAKSG